MEGTQHHQGPQPSSTRPTHFRSADEVHAAAGDAADDGCVDRLLCRVRLLIWETANDFNSWHKHMTTAPIFRCFCIPGAVKQCCKTNALLGPDLGSQIKSAKLRLLITDAGLVGRRFEGDLLTIIAWIITGANTVEAVVFKWVFCVRYWFPSCSITESRVTTSPKRNWMPWNWRCWVEETNKNVVELQQRNINITQYGICEKVNAVCKTKSD